jgi:hypothetical protein
MHRVVHRVPIVKLVILLYTLPRRVVYGKRLKSIFEWVAFESLFNVLLDHFLL